MSNPMGHHGPLDERQRAVHLTHLRAMLDQCRSAAHKLPHKSSREAAERNAETLDWALAQLTAEPKRKARVDA